METVSMADYDPTWPKLFESLRERIAAALGPLALTIEHVGSTSVPNMCAKPIIDLDVLVRAKDVPAAIAAVEALGYQHRGNLGIEGREALRWAAGFPEHHLYLCPEGSAEFKRHVLFRNYLRTHPEVAREYAELKRRLAEQYRDDRSQYQKAKSGFIDSLIERAEREGLSAGVH
jgi:GrpB-like predicted nucleotidyltransferase (UPF0157 family)